MNKQDYLYELTTLIYNDEFLHTYAQSLESTQELKGFLKLHVIPKIHGECCNLDEQDLIQILDQLEETL